MDALLRHSRSMCPFLNKTSPATLRSLSTSTRHVSSGGGTMSNLQVLARRCPVMGKAMAVQSAKNNPCRLNGVSGGVHEYEYGGKAKLHTTTIQHADVAINMLRREDPGLATAAVVDEAVLMFPSPNTSSGETTSSDTS